jgi:hypothetical protein
MSGGESHIYNETLNDRSNIDSNMLTCPMMMSCPQISPNMVPRPMVLANTLIGSNYHLLLNYLLLNYLLLNHHLPL